MYWALSWVAEIVSLSAPTCWELVPKAEELSPRQTVYRSPFFEEQSLTPGMPWNGQGGLVNGSTLLPPAPMIMKVLPDTESSALPPSICSMSWSWPARKRSMRLSIVQFVFWPEKTVLVLAYGPNSPDDQLGSCWASIFQTAVEFARSF